MSLPISPSDRPLSLCEDDPRSAPWPRNSSGPKGRAATARRSRGKRADQRGTRIQRRSDRSKRYPSALGPDRVAPG
jgi:hypothetical protein